MLAASRASRGVLEHPLSLSRKFLRYPPLSAQAIAIGHLPAASSSCRVPELQPMEARVAEHTHIMASLQSTIDTLSIHSLQAIHSATLSFR